MELCGDLSAYVVLNITEEAKPSDEEFETLKFGLNGFNEFYKKQGYQVFGQLDDIPPGYTSFFLKKQID